MGKTSISKNIVKEVTFLGKGGVYSFPFSPDIGDVNKNPQKYEEYLVKSEPVATTPEVLPPEKEEDVIEINGVKYKKV